MQSQPIIGGRCVRPMGKQACSGCPANAVYVYLASRLDSSARAIRNLLAEASNFRDLMPDSQVVGAILEVQQYLFSFKNLHFTTAYTAFFAIFLLHNAQHRHNKSAIMMVIIKHLIYRFMSMKRIDVKQALILTLSILALLTIGVSANAEKIFRWQDDAGSWHYSATPPAEQAAESVNIKAPPTSGPIATTSNKKPDDKKEGNAKEQTTTDPALKKSAEVAAEDKALARKNCENAKKNLANLTNHRRMRINDEETGEVRYLADDEHAKWMKNSKEEVRKNCN